MINPSELSSVHQKLNNNCLSCHEVFNAIPDNKCIACHTVSEIGKTKDNNKDTIKSKRLLFFHRTLTNQKCVNCHLDHKGLNPGKSVYKFNHSLNTNNSINNCTNCHNKPSNNLHNFITSNCANCHITTEWKSKNGFNHKMIDENEKNNCKACHNNPNDSFHSNLKENCSKCHNNNKWKPSSFDHSKYFDFDENHPDKCNSCHLNNNFSAYTCYNCHEHSESKLNEEHNEKGIYNFSKCVSCHKSGNEHDIKMEGQNNKDRKHFKEDDD